MSPTIVDQSVICRACGKNGRLDSDSDGYKLTVRDCKRCDEPVCSECSEADYDLVGDPPYYKCTQWQCKDKCGEANHA